MRDKGRPSSRQSANGLGLEPQSARQDVFPSNTVVSSAKQSEFVLSTGTKIYIARPPRELVRVGFYK